MQLRTRLMAWSILPVAVSLSIYFSNCYLCSLILSLLNFLAFNAVHVELSWACILLLLHVQGICFIASDGIRVWRSNELEACPKTWQNIESLKPPADYTVCIYILICVVRPGKGIKWTLKIQSTAWAKLFTLTSKVYPVLQMQSEVTPILPLPPKHPVEWGITA